MVRKISFLILSVAILIIGVIAFSKLGYWDRSIRIFSFSSDVPFEGRMGRGQEFRGGQGEEGRLNRQERPGERSSRPEMRQIPDSIRAIFEARDGRPDHRMSNGGSRGRGEFPGGKKINLRNVVWFLAVFASFTVAVIYIDKLYNLIRKRKLFITMSTFIFFLFLDYSVVKAQPIPVELMIGYKYGTVNLSFSKNFSQDSRLGFFHMNTVQFDFSDEDKNSFILQDLIYVETFKNLRIAGGVAYSKGGFDPTAGLQYVYSGKKLVFLFAPRINIESDPSYDIMTIIQYKPEINDRVKLFTRLQMLNLFDSEGNIRSYQWMRLGLEVKGIQFGLAANLDEYGPNPSIENNFGVFIRKEIF
jgi:hypothetical protein